MRSQMLNLSVYGRADLSRLGRGRQLLEHILNWRDLQPDRCGVCEPFKRFDLQMAVDLLTRNADGAVSGDVFLERSREPRYRFHLGWSHDGHPFQASSYNIDGEWVRDPAHLEEWLTLCFSLLPMHDAWYARWALDDEREAKQRLAWRVPPNHPHLASGDVIEDTFGSVLTRGIPGVFWGNYFGPFYVDWYGRNRFDSLPCVRKQELPGGGVFFTTAPTPLEWGSPASRQLQRHVAEHLGADTFFNMEAFRERVRRELGHAGVSDPEQLLPTCRVPEFPFPSEPPRPILPLEQERESMIRQQEALGLRLIAEPRRGLLLFEGPGGERVEVDLRQRTLKHRPRQ